MAGSVTDAASTMSSFVLFTHGRVDALLEPIKLSTRVKYTTLAASSQHLALGANTGAVYCFDRRQYRLRRLLANKEGAISLLAFSPGGRLLALTVQKTVIVWDHNVDGRAKPRRVKIVNGESKDGVITAISWDNRGVRLFVGDDKGHVKQMNVAKSKIESRIQMKDSEIVYRADSSIVQIGHQHGHLLVSTRTQCHIINLQPIKSLVRNVGTKPRDGVYGGCLTDSLTVYSARPGSRIWEADINGHVKSTHQLKALLAVAPAVVWGSERETNDSVQDSVDVWEPQSLSFHELQIIRRSHLLAWQPNGVYVFDLANVQVIGWTNQFWDIVSLVCCGNEFFVLHDSATSVSHVAVLSPPEAAQLLYRDGRHKECSQLILQYPHSIKPAASRRYVTLNMLSQLKEHLTTLNHKEEAEGINAILSESESNSESLGAGYYRHSTGIFVVREAPEPHLSRSKSLTMSSVSSLKRYPSAPDSLSQSLSSSLSDIVSCSLNSQVAIREEDAARDTQTDVTDGRVVECDERVLGQEFESAPSSVCSSVCDQSHLDEETVESMKEESVLGYDVMEETDRKRVEETGEHVDGTLLDMREEEKQGIEEDGQGIEEEKEGIEEERTCNGDEDMKSSDVDSALQVPFPEVETSVDQPRIQRLMSLVGIEDTSNSVLKNEDSIATSLLAVRRPSNKEKRKRKKKSAYRRKSFDTLSLVSSDQFEVQSLDRHLLTRSHEIDQRNVLSQSGDYTDMTSFSKTQSVSSSVASSPTVCAVLMSSLSNLVTPDVTVLSRSMESNESEGNSPVRSEKPLSNDSGVVAGLGDEVNDMQADAVKDNESLLSPDLRQFIDETRQTQLSLQTLDVIYSPDKLHSTLNDWRNCLNTHCQTHCNNQSTDNTSHSSQNTTICQYWQNNMRHIKRSSQDVLSSVATQVFEICICAYQLGDEDAASESIKFLQQFLPILNVERVRQALVNSGNYTYECWRVLTQDAHHAPLGDVDKLSEHIRHVCGSDQCGFFLPILSKLYLMDAESAVRLCIELHPSVQPIEVAFLCGVMPRRLDEALDCECRFGLYLNYLNELTDSSSAVAARHHTLHQISQDQTLTELWFEAALTRSPPHESLFTPNDKPRVGSHQIEWPEASVLRRILDSSLFQYSAEKMLCLCQKHGYWLGCIELLCRLKRRWSAIEVVVYLGDIHLIQTTQKWGDLPASVGEWRHLLSVMSSSDSCNRLDSSLMWEAIAVTLVDKLGAARTCCVLNQTDVSLHYLPDGFMHLVYKCARSEAAQRSTCQSLLEKYDSYLWSPKLAALSPHFRHLMDCERRDKNQKRDYFTTSSLLILKTGEGLGHVLEDGACHWGVRVQQDRSDCPVSSLPLNEHTSSGPGASQLAVFNSGQVYHKAYVPEQACIVTFNKQFQSLDKRTDPL